MIRRFRIPIFLLPIYQAAGVEYGVRWEVLAAINEIETDYGRNLNVSSAGAVGWMQFMPGTWRRYGVDANRDGRRDPYNPADAIFAAANYLKAAGYQDDVRSAIFAYNHAGWYVDSVLLRARLIAMMPADLVGSLTGLSDGRLPVAARSRYYDDLADRPGGRRSIAVYARSGAPVVAVNDGIIKEIGRSAKLGRYLVLQDVYGNRYLYAHLGSVARRYPVPKRGAHGEQHAAQAMKARGGADASQASAPSKQRLFAHPYMEGARQAGGLDQLRDARARRNGARIGYREYFSRPLGLDPSKMTLRRLRRGSRVIGGTILGRVGRAVPNRTPHIGFSIRPAGRGAPRIDPKPILDGWKLLEATAIYRASGRNVLHGNGAGGMSIGQIMLLPQPQLERRVLGDDRIEIYAGGRDDIRSGQINRRVLATLEYLAESGLRPTVSCLKSGHSLYTSSGNISEHASGNAVDISRINGIPILGHQEPGGVAEQTVQRLMMLQGTVAPHQIISLLELGGSTMAMADHADHIHVGFKPLFGANRKLGRQALAVLEPGQWSDLMRRLRHIDQPRLARRDSGNAGHRIPIAETHRPRDAAAADAARASEPRPRRRIDPHAGAALEPAKRRQLCQRVIGDGRISTKVAPPAQVCVYCTGKEGPRSQGRRGRRREAGNRSRDGPRAPPSRDRPACDRWARAQRQLQSIFAKVCW